MLHRYPLRRPMQLPLMVCCLLFLAWALALLLFFCAFAPNWDVPLLYAACCALLLLPVALLALPVWGQRTLQVEHAGVVVADYLWGRRVHRRVYLADAVRHFTWEQGADGSFALQLVTAPRGWDWRYGAPPRLYPATVLHTRNPYLLYAVWRDLELHYPGSGLREAPTAGVGIIMRRPAVGLALLLAAAGCAVAAVAAPLLLTPLKIAALGQVSPAVVRGFDWETNAHGSHYRAVVSPVPQPEHRCTGVTPLPQSPYMPQEGQVTEVLWYGTAFYSPQEVLPFLLPLPLAGSVLLLLFCALYCLIPEKYKVQSTMYKSES